MDPQTQQGAMISALEEAAQALAQLLLLLWADGVQLEQLSAKFPSQIPNDLLDWRIMLEDLLAHPQFLDELSNRLQTAVDAREKAIQCLEVWMQEQKDLEIPAPPPRTPKYIFTPYLLVFPDEKFQQKDIFTHLTTYFVATCNFDYVLSPPLFRDFRGQMETIDANQTEAFKRGLGALKQPGPLHRAFRKMRGVDPTIPTPSIMHRQLTEQLAGNSYRRNYRKEDLLKRISALSSRLWTSTYLVYPYAFMLAAQILRVDAVINSPKESIDMKQLPKLEAQLREWSTELQTMVPAKNHLQQCLAAAYIRRLVNIANHYLARLAELQGNSTLATEHEEYSQKYYERMNELYTEASAWIMPSVLIIRQPEVEQFLDDYFQTLYHDPSTSQQSYIMSFIKNRLSRFVEDRERAKWAPTGMLRKQRLPMNVNANTMGPTRIGGSAIHNSASHAGGPDVNLMLQINAGDFGYYYEDPHRPHHHGHGHGGWDPMVSYGGGGYDGGHGHGHGGGGFDGGYSGGDFGSGGGGGGDSGGGGGDSGGGGGDSGGGGGGGM